MSEDERKPRIHINIGLLIIIIIIVLVLFKVDLFSKINSPQFQKNITYIEETAKDIWENYILKPIKNKTIDSFINTGSSGIQKFQENFNNNITKIPTEEDIKKAS